jgi:hypothetical protein
MLKQLIKKLKGFINESWDFVQESDIEIRNKAMKNLNEKIEKIHNEGSDSFLASLATEKTKKEKQRLDEKKKLDIVKGKKKDQLKSDSYNSKI